MSSRKPEPSGPSEEELLEQWDFLDAMVERQASALRAGIQDVEEEDALAATSELEPLRRRLDEVRAELTATENRRAETAADLNRQQRAFAALHEEHQSLRAAHSSALAGAAALDQRLQSYVSANEDTKAHTRARESELLELRERLRRASEENDAAETRHVAELESLHQRLAAELAAGQSRLQRAQAALSRLESSHAELLEALRSAHREVEALQAERSQAARHHFWRWRR